MSGEAQEDPASEVLIANEAYFSFYQPLYCDERIQQTKMKCPSFEHLLDYLDGLLTPSETARIEGHLAAGCHQCHEYRQWYEGVRAITASDDSEAPPPWVLKRALRIFEARLTRPRIAARVGQLVASLVFDSMARPALAGTRSTESANRQLLYRAGDYSVDLQIAASTQTSGDLLGQVLREGEVAFDSVAGLKLELAAEGRPSRSAVTDQMGEFTINQIECGVYDLRIEMPEGSVTIPGLPVMQS
jgi:hypothetical protein